MSLLNSQAESKSSLSVLCSGSSRLDGTPHTLPLIQFTHSMLISPRNTPRIVFSQIPPNTPGLVQLTHVTPDSGLEATRKRGPSCSLGLNLGSIHSDLLRARHQRPALRQWGC